MGSRARRISKTGLSTVHLQPYLGKRKDMGGVTQLDLTKVQKTLRTRGIANKQTSTVKQFTGELPAERLSP